ncbi:MULTISPECIES: hypothetical protein [Stenotrophomonas]|uniref:Uncharacterized protein n=1 Tax=Stenotrophomonas maltophilia TaxID=40324 RepID=A0A3S0HFN7_STEMA|nr:hypothetical protein [Stenotrophomonas maltophilia]RTQ90454.1 hypothetical protein EKL94_06775 [Stenotrophomonas maltophilia]
MKPMRGFRGCSMWRALPTVFLMMLLGTSAALSAVRAPTSAELERRIVHLIVGLPRTAEWRGTTVSVAAQRLALPVQPAGPGSAEPRISGVAREGWAYSIDEFSRKSGTQLGIHLFPTEAGMKGTPCTFPMAGLMEALIRAGYSKRRIGGEPLPEDMWRFHRRNVAVTVSGYDATGSSGHSLKCIRIITIEPPENGNG